ncbi:MAG: hypothetical protein J1E43_04085 [Christensenellaceae bacterium]|nr:hypothetical protein [Christensenellaceae bacterium]
MKNRFQSEIDARLSDLTFTGQEQVLRRIRARRTVRPLPKRTVILVAALMLMLCGTAVALTLRYSARFDLERHARGILSSKYGLTGEMLDMFAARVEQGEDGWTVRFVPYEWEDLMGVYTVTGGKSDSTRATWTFDDAEPSESIWGPEGIQRFMDARKALHAAETQNQVDYSTLTLEERAAIDAPMLDVTGLNIRVHFVPGEDDLQPAEAERMARQTVMDKYGISEEELNGYQTSMDFYMYTEEKNCKYWIELYGGLSRFIIELSSPEGEILKCSWWSTKDSVALPEGDLSLYPEAAREYVRQGAFEELSAEEKAEVYRRYEEAGLSDLLPEGEFVTPAPADLNEQAAIAKAKEALMAKYEFPEVGFKLFGVRTAMLRRDEGREWQIRFIAQDSTNFYWLDERTLGVYTVTVAGDGTATDCEWSLDDLYRGPHTEETFGQAQVYTGKDLGYMMTLIGKLDEIISKYPDYPNYVWDGDMSLEDRAAYDGLMRQAGFNPRTFSSLLPKDGDMSQQEAYALARQVLKDEYGMTDEELDSSTQEVYFWTRYDLHVEPIRGWDIAFKGKEIYTVFINAEEGVIEQINHDDLSLSNG